MKKRLVTVKVLAEYIGVSENCIYTLNNQGKLPPQWIIHIGKRGLRFDLQEVDKTIEELKNNPNKENVLFRIHI